MSEEYPDLEALKFAFDLFGFVFKEYNLGSKYSYNNVNKSLKFCVHIGEGVLVLSYAARSKFHSLFENKSSFFLKSKENVRKFIKKFSLSVIESTYDFSGGILFILACLADLAVYMYVNVNKLLFDEIPFIFRYIFCDILSDKFDTNGGWAGLKMASKPYWPIYRSSKVYLKYSEPYLRSSVDNYQQFMEVLDALESYFRKLNMEIRNSEEIQNEIRNSKFPAIANLFHVESDEVEKSGENVNEIPAEIICKECDFRVEEIPDSLSEFSDTSVDLPCHSPQKLFEEEMKKLNKNAKMSIEITVKDNSDCKDLHAEKEPKNFSESTSTADFPCYIAQELPSEKDIKKLNEKMNKIPSEIISKNSSECIVFQREKVPENLSKFATTTPYADVPCYPSQELPSKNEIKNLNGNVNKISAEIIFKDSSENVEFHAEKVPHNLSEFPTTQSAVELSYQPAEGESSDDDSTWVFI